MNPALWTPASHRDRATLEREAAELRYLLELIVEQHGPLTVTLNDDERVPGQIRWEKGALPGQHAEATVWFQPSVG